MITPTVGCIVWFYPASNQATSGFAPADEGQPLAGIIAKVLGDRAVHLTVFDSAGVSHPQPYVQLVQEGDDVPGAGRYATWMPYQIGQAKKSAAAVGTKVYADGTKATGLAPLPDTSPEDDPIERQIQAKGLTAPRVTPADIEANIASEHYFTAGHGVAGAIAARVHAGMPAGYTGAEAVAAIDGALGLLTFCVLVLRNGFTVTGESACASPENFDAAIGQQIARKNAIDKVWPLMGYALKEQLAQAPANGYAQPYYPG